MYCKTYWSHEVFLGLCFLLLIPPHRFYWTVSIVIFQQRSRLDEWFDHEYGIILFFFKSLLYLTILTSNTPHRPQTMGWGFGNDRNNHLMDQTQQKHVKIMYLSTLSFFTINMCGFFCSHFSLILPGAAICRV